MHNPSLLDGQRWTSTGCLTLITSTMLSRWLVPWKSGIGGCEPQVASQQDMAMMAVNDFTRAGVDRVI